LRPWRMSNTVSSASSSTIVSRGRHWQPERMRRPGTVDEVAKATQEARAGRPQRAINLIFGTEWPTMVDSAFWRQQLSTAEDDTVRTDWVYV
jgi:hypothetical protein